MSRIDNDYLGRVGPTMGECGSLGVIKRCFGSLSVVSEHCPMLWV